MKKISILLMLIILIIACEMGTLKYVGKVTDVEYLAIKKDALFGHSMRDGRLLTLETAKGKVIVAIETKYSDSIVVGENYKIFYSHSNVRWFAKRIN